MWLSSCRPESMPFSCACTCGNDCLDLVKVRPSCIAEGAHLGMSLYSFCLEMNKLSECIVTDLFFHITSPDRVCICPFDVGAASIVPVKAGLLSIRIDGKICGF